MYRHDMRIGSPIRSDTRPQRQSLSASLIVQATLIGPRSLFTAARQSGVGTSQLSRLFSVRETLLWGPRLQSASSSLHGALGISWAPILNRAVRDAPSRNSMKTPTKPKRLPKAAPAFLFCSLEMPYRVW